MPKLQGQIWVSEIQQSFAFKMEEQAQDVEVLAMRRCDEGDVGGSCLMSCSDCSSEERWMMQCQSSSFFSEGSQSSETYPLWSALARSAKA